MGDIQNGNIRTIVVKRLYEAVHFQTRLLHDQNRIHLKKGKSCERKV